MNDYVSQLLRKHRNTGLIIDTNLFVLFVVGSYDPQRIESFKRTRQYTASDYELLSSLIRRVNRILTLPGILAETSNLVGQLTGRYRSECLAVLSQIALNIEEHHVPIADIVRLDEFARFGITDAAVLQLARMGHLVLTDDLDLSVYLESHGLAVLNFTHLREPGLLR